MDVWPRVPELLSRPECIAEPDWCLMEDAAETTLERRARWVWHEIASEAVRLMAPGEAHEQAAIEASDALNMLTEDDACMAAAAACRTVVMWVGPPAARLIAMMAYAGCRPSSMLMSDCFSAVATFEVGGRVYVA